MYNYPIGKIQNNCNVIAAEYKPGTAPLVMSFAAKLCPRISSQGEKPNIVAEFKRLKKHVNDCINELSSCFQAENSYSTNLIVIIISGPLRIVMNACQSHRPIRCWLPDLTQSQVRQILSGSYGCLTIKKTSLMIVSSLHLGFRSSIAAGK